jgi:Fe-S oxidoreductase
MTLTHPAYQIYLGIPGYVFSWTIFVSALSVFIYIMYKRYTLVSSGQKDPRFDDLAERFKNLAVNGFLQKRQPRYLWAGLIHIFIFWGFIVLGLRSVDLVSQGLGLPFLSSVMSNGFGTFYGSLKDIFELIVFFACMWAILRRAVLTHERYEGSHIFEAYFVLSLITFLMVTDIFFEGSAITADGSSESFLPASYLAAFILKGFSIETLTLVNKLSYWLHIICFFLFLVFLPLGKHFHIITALPSVFLRKLRKGSIKPARWGVDDIEDLDSLGIEKFEDFTWKHILDFLSCTECGRCSDNCPANTVGRPLSPKMLTIKLKEHGQARVPLLKGKKQENNDLPIAGGVISHEEIWSCTTCGACEEECPVFIEYIDKIIDLRRYLIETAQNPKTFNQVLMNFEKTGNPFGKPAAKRADWVNDQEDLPLRILKEGDKVDLLYFVDSYGSFDPTAQGIASAIVKGLNQAGIDFGILGPLEKDSGHQVRRMGEEGLFQLLVEENMETLAGIRFNSILTTDPHAFNTLKNDYPETFTVFHYTQFFKQMVERGKLKPAQSLDGSDIYTYHDPCYLGRHNGVYEEPRWLIKSIPGIRFVEMERSRDKSFCCGGGDIILWHEIEQEEMRMAEKRIKMARDLGANVIITSCPFCNIHFEDAIKTSGLEGEMRVVDLMELLISTVSEG